MPLKIIWKETRNPPTSGYWITTSLYNIYPFVVFRIDLVDNFISRDVQILRTYFLLSTLWFLQISSIVIIYFVLREFQKSDLSAIFYNISDTPDEKWTLPSQGQLIGEKIQLRRQKYAREFWNQNQINKNESFTRIILAKMYTIYLGHLYFLNREQFYRWEDKINFLSLRIINLWVFNETIGILIDFYSILNNSRRF